MKRVDRRLSKAGILKKNHKKEKYEEFFDIEIELLLLEVKSLLLNSLMVLTTIVLVILYIFKEG